jgi:hypothetical protein
MMGHVGHPLRNAHVVALRSRTPAAGLPSLVAIATPAENVNALVSRAMWELKLLL